MWVSLRRVGRGERKTLDQQDLGIHIFKNQ